MSDTIDATIPELIEDLGCLYPRENSNNKKHYGIYKCGCGANFKAVVSRIKSGHTKSCGCFRKKSTSERRYIHGMTHHPLYGVWGDMKKRTSDKNNKSFENYGGRGISVCDEWKDDFTSFYNWSINNGYKKGIEIDRIDNDGNYEPSNCRWVDRIIQAQNKRVLMSTNTSGHKGVHWAKKEGSWIVKIRSAGVTKYLGSFKDINEASKTYNSYVLDNKLSHSINL